jgi:hypothetical protein
VEGGLHAYRIARRASWSSMEKHVWVERNALKLRVDSTDEKKPRGSNEVGGGERYGYGYGYG